MDVILIFDVNETLLDLSALDGRFERIFGDAGVRTEWFETMIQSAMLGIITETYHEFGAVAKGALETVAARRNIKLTGEDTKAVLRQMRELPPHPDVVEGLALLQNAGMRLVALTNSALTVVQAQLDYAGLTGYFERIFSADTVKRLKPAAEPYEHVAAALGVPVPNLKLVAAHAWDVAGAKRAGCGTVFVARPGKVLDPLALQPDVVAQDLLHVARKLLGAESGSL